MFWNGCVKTIRCDLYSEKNKDAGMRRNTLRPTKNKEVARTKDEIRNPGMLLQQSF